MMKKRYIGYVALAGMLLAGCTDLLYDEGLVGYGSGDVGFALNVTEQADMQIGVGGATRSAGGTRGSSGNDKGDDGDHFTAHPLEGNNAYGLMVHKMPLPLVGIHKGAVTASGNAATSEEPTRAAWGDRVTSAETFHDSITVWGYTQSGTEIFEKTLVQRVTNYRTSGHWPFGEEGLMRFYAVAPSLENTNMLAATANYATPPELTYTLPEKAQDMVDLLYGSSGDIDIAAFGTKTDHIGKDDKYVDLQFQHILTAVRFAQGKIPAGITVKKISLLNVHTKAQFKPATLDATTETAGAWSNHGTPGNYTMMANDKGSDESTENTYLNDSVFYMLPQTVPSGVTLEIVIESKPKYIYDSSGAHAPTESTVMQEHTLTCSLSGDVWKKGYTVTYMITIGEVADGYYFVAVPPAELPHSDSQTPASFTVHSFRQYIDYEPETPQDVTSHAVSWTVVGYSYTEDGDFTSDNKPDWFTDNGGVTSTSSGGYGSTATFTVKPQAATKYGNHETILSNNSVVSEMDLSWYYSKYSKNEDATNKYESQQTANCYIVNRTGSYKFPLIYGNKTSDTKENPIPENERFFVDHTGAVIRYKKIKDQIEAKNEDYHNTSYETGHEGEADHATERYRKAYTWNAVEGDGQSLRAVIVWQDVEDLITGVSAVSDHISFNVNKPQPGNAVIALQAKSLTKYEKRTRSGESTWNAWSVDTSKGTNGYSTGDPWETLWTWHIWMTDEVWPNDGSTDDTQYLNWNENEKDHLVSLTNFGGTESTILPVNLGWVPNKMSFEYYSKRERYVKLQQTEPTAGDKKTVVVKIVQHARQPDVRGQGTFYQWGRPTALPGLNWPDDSKTLRPVYRDGSTDISDEFIVENISGVQDIISHPTKLYRQSNTTTSRWWPTEQHFAYWGATKTVYDPCPPGFQVPKCEIFTGLSMTGETVGTGKTVGNSNDANLVNMWEDAGALNYGGYFYVKPHNDSVPAADRYNQTVYIPSTGQYQATKTAGTRIKLAETDDKTFVESQPGTLWTYDNGDGKKGNAVNIYPQFDRTHKDKPTVELPRKMNYSTACAIRPVKTTE